LRKWNSQKGLTYATEKYRHPFVFTYARVIYISDAPDTLVRDFHMIPAHSIDEAVKMAEEILGNPEASITVIPDGISVVVS